MTSDTINDMKTAIYTRVSTEEQVGGYGLDAQLTKCRAMATVKDWEPVTVFSDEGISGAKGVEHREGLAAMLEAVERDEIGAVIVSALDRLGRNTRLVLELVEQLDAKGVVIVSCKESLDTTTASGKFTLTMFAALAELERNTITERMTGGRNERGKRDGERGGAIPYGFTRELIGGKATGNILIDEPKAAVVRDVLAMREAGATLQAIADNLNDHGVKTARGKRWTGKGVLTICRNDHKYSGGMRGASQVAWPSIYTTAR